MGHEGGDHVSTVEFRFIPDAISLECNAPAITVTYDDTYSPFVEDLISAFEQFLLAMTYQPGSIAKYIDTEKVAAVRTDIAGRVAELKRDMAARKAKVKGVKK